MTTRIHTTILWRSITGLLLLIVLAIACSPDLPVPPTLSAEPERTLSILVDDFRPQPYPGQSIYPYNRLGGDRGAIGSSSVTWGDGQVTTTVAAGGSSAGVWMSLNHPVAENLPLNFGALLPAPILPAYQSRVTGLMLQVAGGTAGRPLRVELKDGDQLRWSQTTTLSGGAQTLSFDLPALGAVGQLVWVLDSAAPSDQVVLSRIALTATTTISDTATAAFVWSYAMLLNSWSPTSGLVRDKGHEASGVFDAIQSTGSLAAATALAEQLGVISRADATRVVSTISRALLVDTPRFHGLWPHFVNVSASGAISIAPGTEWSSVDTVIAVVGLLDAQSALGLDTFGTEEMLRAVDWADLIKPNGMVSHGYDYGGARIGGAWDVFGGESWLVDMAYAGASGSIAPLNYSTPPTANGAGFIDELAWLYITPPATPDAWGNDWTAYRLAAADAQIAYPATAYPASCVAQLGLFGLSAGEVPDPSLVQPWEVYQAFGVGGRFGSANDGAALFGTPVVAPHAAALVAALRPQAALGVWDWLIQSGAFSPLNNVESLAFLPGASCDAAGMRWNHMQGSWNLSLQTLGWGRYLAERAGKVPSVWQATSASQLLRRGYRLLVPAVFLPVVAR